MTTFTYTPTLDYPKKYLDLSEEERESFDIDDKKKVAEFIGLALSEIHKNDKIRPDDNNLFINGQIIESMLDECFGVNLDDRPYKEFVMEYVLKNFEKSRERHEKYVKAINNGQLKGGLFG